MIQIDCGNEYVIYLDRQPGSVTLPQSDKFKYEVVPASIPAVGLPFREQVLLRRQIAEDKLDIVHFLCNTAPVSVPNKFILSLLDVIQVKTPQTFSKAKGLESYKRWMINSYSKWTILKTIPKAERVITLSLYEKEQIVEHLNVEPQRICVTYYGINPVFTPVNSLEKKQTRAKIANKFGIDRRFILGVGYEPRKNIPLLIESFSRVASIFSDVDLVIVAAAEDRRQYFLSLASELGLNGRVKGLPAVGPRELAVLYNHADAFIFPSERESFGAPPLESLACGTPTIAMNMTSLPEILGDGAMLIDGKDVNTWADAISQVLSDIDLRIALVSRGIHQASKYSWKRCAQETVDIYHSVAGEI